MRSTTIIATVLLASLWLCGSAMAQGGYEIVSSTVNAGGTSSDGSYTMRGTAGQAEATVSTGGGYTLTSGYWTGTASSELTGGLYLPMIER